MIMKKVLFYRLLPVLLLAISIPIFLFFSTSMPNQKPNGFSRRFINSPQIIKEKNIPDELTQICGLSTNTIYLKGESPKAILEIDKNMNIKDTILINLALPENKIAPCYVRIDSPLIYLHFNNLSLAYYGSIKNGKLNSTKLETPIFSKSSQISPFSLTIRSFDSSFKNQIFKKMSILTGKEVCKNSLIKSTGDAGVSSDGMLFFNNESSKLFFVEYFQNQFYCLDSNLNLTYKGNTIDTISSSDIKVSFELDKSGTHKLVPSNSRVIVNKMAFSNRNYLFVISGLKADNEKRQMFRENDVIDVYKISSGKYYASFYLPKLNGKPLKSAYFNNKTITVLYQGKLIEYGMPVLLL
jgi:hypothetical protein